MLAVNKSLSVLDLSGCGVTDAVAQYIGAGLAENNSLQALSIIITHMKMQNMYINQNENPETIWRQASTII